MFYGWDMTGNVSARKVAIQNAAMNIGFHQFSATSPFSHPTLPLASHLGREHSEPRSEHVGNFFLCRALMVLGSGLPFWLHIEIAWELLKSLMSRSLPKPIKLESLGRDPVVSII